MEGRSITDSAPEEDRDLQSQGLIWDAICCPAEEHRPVEEPGENQGRPCNQSLSSSIRMCQLQ